MELGHTQVTHSFLVVPECPCHLMERERDLLQKHEA